VHLSLRKDLIFTVCVTITDAGGKFLETCGNTKMTSAVEITKNKIRTLALLSLGLNLALAVSQYLLYLFSRSNAVFAGSIHSLTDTVGGAVVVLGIYLSERKSEHFPWGLYKLENISAIILAGMILISSYWLVLRIIEPLPMSQRNLDVTLFILFLLTIPILLFAKYESRKAAALNSPALIADAKHWKMDLAPFAVVIFGIAASTLSYPVLDRLAAVLILILVLKSGFIILKDSVKSLLDASVDKATLNEIERTVKEFPQVTEIISVNARNSGRFIFAYLYLRLSLKRLKDAHEIAHSIEKELKERVPFVERVIIHYAPETKDYKRYAVGLANREGKISEHFGRAPFVALWDKRADDGSVLKQEVIENPYLNMEKGKGIKLAEMLTEMGVDIVYSKEEFTGKGPEYVLSGAEAEMRKTDDDTLSDLIEIAA